MFAEFADGARSIRSHLVAGYTTMFTLWIWFGDELPERRDLNEPALSVVDLYHRLSAAGQAALWTFVALLLGAFLCRAFLDRVVEWVLRNGPNWDEYINAARMAARRYEEHVPYDRSDRPGLAFGRTGSVVPSAAWSEHLADEIRDRERKHGETRFRALLAVCLIPPACVLIVRSGFDPFWLAAFLPTLAIFVDLTMIQHPVNDNMYRDTRRSIEAEVKEAEAAVAELSEGVFKHEQDGTDPGRLLERLDSAEAKFVDATVRLRELKKPQPLGLWRLFSRTR